MAKILWHSCAPWAPSGYGTQTAIWTQELQKMGHEVVISSYWGMQGAPTEWRGMTVLPGFGTAYCSTSLNQHAKQFQPDLVITLGDVWVMDPNLLRELPLAHWLPSDCRPMSLADRACVEASGAELIAMSKFGFDRFTTAGFNPVYVPHAIKMDMFKPVDNWDDLRESCGLTSGEFVIGINGANNDAIRKALPEQMLAFAKFTRKYPNSILTLHSGVHQDGGQDLEAVAENLGIVDKIRVVDQYRYHAGLVQPADLNEWYNAIDIMAACSYGEGFGLPIIESMAAGTPVITTKSSSMEELNPYGYHVDGEPFWNGVHKGWWIRPSMSELTKTFEKAYLNRDRVKPAKLRKFAERYDVNRVRDLYMKPAIDELLERMKKKG
jgi:glycosyltransferase involved in cell wall biosynthesis